MRTEPRIVTRISMKPKSCTITVSAYKGSKKLYMDRVKVTEGNKYTFQGAPERELKALGEARSALIMKQPAGYLESRWSDKSFKYQDYDHRVLRILRQKRVEAGMHPWL